jgi:putative ABC transport system permease protein
VRARLGPALGALLSHWRHRPGQALAAVLGLALATGLWTGVQAINAEARKSYAEAARALGAEARTVLVAAGGGEIEQSVYVALRRAGWPVAPVVEGRLRAAGGPVRLLGFDPLTAPPGTAAAGPALGEDPLAFLTPPGLLLAAPATAARLAERSRAAPPATGDTPAGPQDPAAPAASAALAGQVAVTGDAAQAAAGRAGRPDAPSAASPPEPVAVGASAAAAASPGPPALPPVRAVEGLPPGVAFADIGTAQRLLDRPGRLSRLVLLEEAAPVPGRPAIAEIAPGLREEAPRTAADIGRLTESFHLNLTAFGLLAFAVGLFIVQSVIGLAFEQRRPMLRTLRALGLPVRGLLLAAVAELAGLALLAGILGIGLGYLFAAALLPDVAATLRGLYGASVEGTLTLAPGWWLGGLALAILGTALAGARSLWTLARLPVLAPARPRAWANAAGRGGRWLALGCAACIAAAAVLARPGGGLVAGFGLVAALMLAFTLALPLVLRALLRFGEATARGPVAQWFWADSRQQLPGLSMALAALLLALAANIGVGTMVGSFRATFTGWLDQRLAAELYVGAREGAEAARMAAWLAPRGVTVLPNWSAEAEIADQPGEVLAAADHATWRENWPLLAALPGTWEAVASGGALLVNEQLARREGLAPGDSLPLPGGPPLLVAGVYSDYGNPRAQVLLADHAFIARFPSAERLSFGLRVPPSAGAPAPPSAPAAAPETEAETAVRAIAEGLVEEVGLDPERVIDQAAIKRFSLEVFERTFAVTAALNLLTLAVAGFAIFTSLLTLAAMRRPQLAPVWALGLPRARLARLELLRALLLAGLTALWALPAGLALAWALLEVINVEAFGWRLPMLLFPAEWARLAALAAAAAVLASLLPSLGLWRGPPARLLAVFAHER